MAGDIIRAKNLTAKYGEMTVLDDIDFSVRENEVMVILGGSGCGKTTLLKNIIRLYQPAAGSIEIFGQDVTYMEETDFAEILHKIGVLFQNGALLNSMSVGENVALPLQLHSTVSETVIQRVVRQKLHLVELDQALNLMPSELSGGMRKRAALARAIALEPLLLFGDEPSAGLDPATSASLDALLLKLKHYLNMTMVIVTHELASIHRIADRITFLHDGHIIFVGTLDEAGRAGIPQVDEFFEYGKF
ncbi:ATP-binding cassette domain-containing protein [bacterium]|nr:ATP-binding cassette domain-containing protein [bacterium]